MIDEIHELTATLDEHLAVRDESGNVVIQVAMILNFYFEDPHRADVREAVVSCCEDYLELAGPELRWEVNPDTDRMQRFGRGKGSKPRSWLLERSEDESFSIHWHSAAFDRGAGASSLDSFGAQRRPYTQHGFFRVSFPLLSLADRPGLLLDAALKISRKLKPVSGYGGIGLIESAFPTVSGAYEPIAYQLAQRFPGLEVDYPISHSHWLDKGIKGVNWLTIVGDRWLGGMGGAAAVEAGVRALDPRFVLQRFDGGLVIQAGPKPALGDAERGRFPELYVKLAKYLRPIRIIEHRPFHQHAGGIRFDRERSEAWLRRFDDR